MHDIGRVRSISVVNQRGTTTAGGSSSLLLPTHCLDNFLPAHSKTKCQTHPHRSRSKTVSCQLYKCQTHDALAINKRRNFGKSQLTEADRLNGNVVDGVSCTVRTSTDVSPTRLLQRNRSQVNSRYLAHHQQSQQPSASQSPQSTNKITIQSNLIKRGKRTLSSTQIEREKADEKSVKVLKKHAALRSLSPLLVTSSRTAKKNASTTNAK